MHISLCYHYTCKGGGAVNDDMHAEQTITNEDNRRSEDELWKELISGSFHDMLRSVLPDMAKVADTSKPVRFLETELRRLARFTRRYSSSHPDSRKFVDILAEVPLISGENAWILLHVEIQGRGGKEDFPLRMHRYRCLLEGRYNRPVAGLAILVQPIPADQAEGIYCWEGYGSRVLYEYPVFKIYEGDEERLQKSDNPFDLAHYAGMQAWKQRGSDTRKLDYMKLLLAELDRRGWSHEAKMALLWFIEGVMHIEDDSAWNEWEEELEKRKETGDMYVSLMERKGIKKGVQQGIQQGKIEMIREMLRWGDSDEKILACARISSEELAEIKEQIRRETN
jgi:predicted transposase/invertase (TIGR01784 family)